MEMLRSNPFGAAGASMMNRGSKKFPLIATDHISPATRLLEKRRQMFEVQEALDAQKEEFARRQDAYRCREEGLRKKDLELQENLIKFNKFLQENESKRSRALKRASEEVKIRVSKEEEVVKLKAQLEQLIQVNDQLSCQVKNNLKYMRYLELVQESAPEDFAEVVDLVNRYRTLQETNTDLSRNQDFHELECEKKRTDVATFEKDCANEILTFNNEIASLQRELEMKITNNIRLQQETDATLRATTQKTLALGQIFMSIGNLVQRCTGGQHGMILKHTDGSSNVIDNAHGANGDQTLPNAVTENGANQVNVPTTGVPDDAFNRAHGNVNEHDILQYGRKAMADLEVVAAYMIDFTSIVQGRLDAQRSKRN